MIDVDSGFDARQLDTSPEKAQRYSNLFRRANTVKNLLIAQDRKPLTHDMGSRPGVSSNAEEVSNSSGLWVIDQWSGAETGFAKQTFNLIFQPIEDHPANIEGLESIQEIRMAVVSVDDARTKLNNRFFSLQVTTHPKNRGDSEEKHNYTLSVDLPNNVSENTLSRGSEKSLELEQAETVLGVLENGLSSS